ncbi:MAG: type II toxin-antitoxin system VapC family toxin [Promethearchaeota archaeon]
MLDSTACIDYLNGKQGIKEKLDENEALLCTTTISIYEVVIGLERTKRKKSEKRYNKLNKNWLELLSNIHVFSLDQKSAELAAGISDDLEEKGIRIDDNDILICGIMKAKGIGRILTRNTNHFNNVENIKVLKYET